MFVYEEMLGVTFKSVTGEEDGDTLVFVSENGARYTFFHE